MHFFCASIDHETNRLSPIPTSLQSFREGFLYRPAQGEDALKLDFILSGTNLISISKARGHEVSIGLIAATHPSAPCVQSDYEALRDELLEDLRRAMPVDAVVLRLHGAMAAVGYDDCEGDILKRIRSIVGDDIPIGVLFDLHGNITPQMVESATLLLGCQEYPHVDFDTRAEQLVDLIERTVRGEVHPVSSFTPIPMVGAFYTFRQPMRGFVDQMIQLESQGTGILAISATHGFLLSNTPIVGSGVLVVADRDAAKAARLSEELAQNFFAMREEISTKPLFIEEALEQAVNSTEGPVVLADMSDNPGGGNASDSTFILKEMIRRNVTNAAIGMIYDPIAVNLCSTAGTGAKIPLRVGGKFGPGSGSPVDLYVTVTQVTDNLWQWAMGAKDNLGPAACVSVDGIDIVLTTTRQQVLSPECFTNLGINLETKQLIIVKSTQHFQATFDAIASDTIFVETPPQMTGHSPEHLLDNLPRPLWPFDNPSFESNGRVWLNGNRHT